MDVTSGRKLVILVRRSLKGLLVNVIPNTHLTRIKHLKEASVLTLHCSPTWEKSSPLLPIRHTPEPFSTTVEVTSWPSCSSSCLSCDPCRDALAGLFPAQAPLGVGCGLQTGNAGSRCGSQRVPSLFPPGQSGHGLKAPCSSEGTATWKMVPTHHSKSPCAGTETESWEVKGN